MMDGMTDAERAHKESMMAMMQSIPITEETRSRGDEINPYKDMISALTKNMNRKQRRAFKANLRKIEKQEARKARNAR